VSKFITLNENYSEIGGIANCFYAFFLLDDVLYSVHRRHRLFSLRDWSQKKSENFSEVILTTYQDKDPRQKISEEVICLGEDPRVTSNGKKAFILSKGALNTNDLYILTSLPEKKNTSVRLGHGVGYGKNWQPVLKNEKLYIIDSIAPFRINTLDVNTGIISKEKQIETDFFLKATHDNYSVLRGGSNSLIFKDTFYGWGHATVKPYAHVPFIWKYNTDKLTTSFVGIYTIFKERGYHIVDPTSFFEWDTVYFALGVSCSQRDWFHSQWFLNGILLIKKEEFFKNDISSFVLDTKTSSLFFHTTELDTLIDSKSIHGGLSNNGLSGCLVCGPSKEINITKKWVVELCYSSDNKASTVVGYFDIYLSINGQDRQVAITKIYGTFGKIIRVKLSFEDVSTHSKALIQTRVFTRKKKSVIAYFFELTNE